MFNNKYTVALINLVLILISVFIVIKISYVFGPLIDVLQMFITPIIISIFLYYALRPVTNKLIRSKKDKGPISLVIVFTFISFLIATILIGGTVVRSEFEKVFTENQDRVIDLVSNIDRVLENFSIDIFDNILNKITNYIGDIGTNAGDVFSGIGNLGTQIVLIPFILFYLLKDEDKIGNRLKSLFPGKYKNELVAMINDIDGVLSTYIGGQLLVASIIGALMFIGYLIIRMPNPFLLAAFAMITDLIPLIGPFIGVAPAVFIALTVDSSLIIKVIILVIVVQQLESNIITPNIMGNRLKIHPVGVILIVLTSVHLMGILGAFVGIPAYLIASIIIKGILSIRTDKG